jgi:DsbC/DsbD-like thiol-disulfide interchange protein
MTARQTTACLALIALVGVALAQEGKLKRRADRVQVTVEADPVAADGTQTLLVRLKIDDGWWIYANAAGNREESGTETSVQIVRDNQVLPMTASYPAGTEIVAPDVGNFRIYTGEVQIQAKVRRAKGDTLPLRVTVFYYPRSAAGCGVLEQKTVVVP